MVMQQAEKSHSYYDIEEGQKKHNHWLPIEKMCNMVTEHSMTPHTSNTNIKSMLTVEKKDTVLIVIWL